MSASKPRVVVPGRESRRAARAFWTAAAVVGFALVLAFALFTVYDLATWRPINLPLDLIGLAVGGLVVRVGLRRRALPGSRRSR